MAFRIVGLDPRPFESFYGLSEEALDAVGVRRYMVDQCPGFPDRVELRDLQPGEPVLLLNYEHLPVDTPYRSRHAIFVREGATERYDQIDKVPDVLRHRTLSLRAFDSGGMMVHAVLVEGERLAEAIDAMWERGDVAYLHAHYAVRGCFAARIEPLV